MNILYFSWSDSCCLCVISHIRQLRCIRPYIDIKTASTTATSIVHAKVDYCNSLYYDLGLPECQLNRLQLIQKSLARAVVSKSSHITLSLRSLHWLKIKERIDYKILSLTYKVLPPNFHISMILSLFNHMVALVPLTLSPLLVHLLIPLWK